MNHDGTYMRGESNSVYCRRRCFARTVPKALKCNHLSVDFPLFRKTADSPSDSDDDFAILQRETPGKPKSSSHRDFFGVV